jgi:hypothetical protein
MEQGKNLPSVHHRGNTGSSIREPRITDTFSHLVKSCRRLRFLAGTLDDLVQGSGPVAQLFPGQLSGQLAGLAHALGWCDDLGMAFVEPEKVQFFTLKATVG